MRGLELILLVLALEDTLQTDTRLDIYYLDLAVRACNVGLPVPLVLPDGDTVDLGVLEDALVHNHEVAVEARVYLQVLRRLHEYRPKELVVIRIDGSELIRQLVVLADVLLPDLLRVVRDEAVAVNPDKVG